MASISTVVTMGYGSFGSVNVIPTLGYGAAAEVIQASRRARRPYVAADRRSPSIPASDTRSRAVPSVDSRRLQRPPDVEWDA